MLTSGREGASWKCEAGPASATPRPTSLHDADHYGTHGSWLATTAALPLIVDRIGAAGLEPTSLSTAPASEGLALTI